MERKGVEAYILGQYRQCFRKGRSRVWWDY